MNRLEQLQEHVRRCPPPELVGVARPIIEAEDLAALLAVARAAVALTEPTSPIRGLGACCIYCGEEVLNDGHHSECPWLEFQAALAPLLKEVEL